MIAENDDLRVVFREYPVLGPHSALPAEAALAAQMQGKYQVMHDAMMEAMEPLDQTEIMRLAKENGLDTAKLAQDMQAPSVDRQIQNNLNMGQSMNIQGVPTFIVVRTNPPSTEKPEVVVGPSVSELKTLINQAQNGA
jgi:protein-disulfide isomerase